MLKLVMDYEKRLILPIEGSKDIIFYSLSGTPLFEGYVRVVIGERGPYIEFDKDNVIFDNFHITESCEYRKKDKRVYYVEFRSKDDSYVKLYYQKKTVNYADYLIGYYYANPFELTSNKYEKLII